MKKAVKFPHGLGGFLLIYTLLLLSVSCLNLEYENVTNDTISYSYLVLHTRVQTLELVNFLILHTFLLFNLHDYKHIAKQIAKLSYKINSQGRDNAFWHHKWSNYVHQKGILGRYSGTGSTRRPNITIMLVKVGFLWGLQELAKLFYKINSQGRDNAFWHHKYLLRNYANWPCHAENCLSCKSCIDYYHIHVMPFSYDLFGFSRFV